MGGTLDTVDYADAPGAAPAPPVLEFAGVSTPSSLAEVRAEIDAIDSAVITLLASRQELVRRAAGFKADEQAVRAPDRYARLMASVRERATAAGLSVEVAEATWRAMVDAFIAWELAQHRSQQEQDSSAR